jgi:hypothetical protein
VCIPGLAATSGDDGTDLVLENILPDARGLMWLRPLVPGSYGRRFPRPRVGKAYLFVGSPRVHSTVDPGSFPRSTREAGWVVKW